VRRRLWQKDGKLAGLARPFLEAVASPAATPGGERLGVCGSLGSRLGTNGCGAFEKKEIASGFVDQLSAALDEIKIAMNLAEAIDRDAASYDAVMRRSSYTRECAGNARGRGSHAKATKGRGGSAAAGCGARC